MLGTHDLLLFVVSGLLLNLTPGTDTLFIATHAAAGGLRAGITAALGIIGGCSLHVLAATLGLSALLASSAAAFMLVKLAGAAYLVWLGVSMLRSNVRSDTKERSTAAPPRAPPKSAPLQRIAAQGLLTNVLNPKMALFFLAFLPHFIDPQATHKALAFLFLGAVFTLNSLTFCLVLALLASRAGRLKLPPRAVAWLQRILGIAFVGFGLRLALAER